MLQRLGFEITIAVPSSGSGEGGRRPEGGGVAFGEPPFRLPAPSPAAQGKGSIGSAVAILVRVCGSDFSRDIFPLKPRGCPFPRLRGKVAGGRKGAALHSESAPFRLPAPSPAAQGEGFDRKRGRDPDGDLWERLQSRCLDFEATSAIPSSARGGRWPEAGRGRRCIRRAPYGLSTPSRPQRKAPCRSIRDCVRRGNDVSARRHLPAGSGHRTLVDHHSCCSRCAFRFGEKLTFRPPLHSA